MGGASQRGLAQAAEVEEETMTLTRTITTPESQIMCVAVCALARVKEGGFPVGQCALRSWRPAAFRGEKQTQQQKNEIDREEVFEPVSRRPISATDIAVAQMSSVVV